MHKEPGANIQGAKPQLLPNRQNERIKALSESYLVQRNETLRLKNQEKTLEIAIRRESLITKQLVRQQATYLMISIRSRLLNLPVRCAAKLAAINDRHQCQAILQAEVLTMLEELRKLPQTVEPNWLAKAEEADVASNRKTT